MERNEKELKMKNGVKWQSRKGGVKGQVWPQQDASKRACCVMSMLLSLIKKELPKALEENSFLPDRSLPLLHQMNEAAPL